jgi:hypothetical protein
MTGADAKRLALRVGPWLLLLSAWSWLYAPRLLENMRGVFGSDALNDDMRIQLPDFYHYADKTLFNNDVIGRYHADGTGELFRALYIALAPHVDIVFLAKIISYLMLVVTAAGLGVAALRLGGKPAAFVAVCIGLGSFEFIDRTVGGLPRAFAYPCIAWGLAALAWGRIRTFGVISVIGAGFYPLIPVIGGITLACVLLVLPRHDRGSARHWSLVQRFAMLGVTLFFAIALLAPFALRMRPYGPVIRLHDFAAFPEAGPGGRLSSNDRPPAAPFFDLAEDTAARALAHGSVPLWPAVHELIETKASRRGFLFVVALISAAGVLGAGLRRSGRDFRRVAAFALAVFVGFELAELVSPSLVPSPRYVRYGVAPLVAVVVPSAVVGLLPRRWRLPGRFRRFTTTLWTAGFGALFLAVAGTHSSRVFGFDIRLHASDRGVATAIGNLPPDALVAGWPEGFLDSMALYTKRAAFITYQTYMPYHQGMTLEMRARVEAVIDAYFSTDAAPLRRLRDHFHVTHFLIEPARVHRPGRLFQPLERYLRNASSQLKQSDAPSALTADFGAAVVYRDDRYVLLDLAKL